MILSSYNKYNGITRFIAGLFFLAKAALLVAQPVNARIDSLIHTVTVSSYRSHSDSLRTSAGCFRKVTSTAEQSADHDLCRDYLFSRFKQYLGPENCYLHRFNVLLYRGLSNVVGYKPGKYPWEGIIVVSAHYDSNNNFDKDWSSTCAPGANDNGTGLAALLEIMRVLKNVETLKPVLFAAWDLEEQYHFGFASGSNAWFGKFVKYSRPTNWPDIGNNGHVNISDLAMNVNFDMFGHPLDSLNGKPILWICSGNEDHVSFANNYVSKVSLYVPEMVAVNSGKLEYSDHYTFAARGVPAVENLESGFRNDPYYHTCADSAGNPENICFDFATGVTRGGLAFILEAAGILSPIERKELLPGDVFHVSELPACYALKMKPGIDLLGVYTFTGEKISWQVQHGYLTMLPPKNGLLFFKVDTGGRVGVVPYMMRGKRQGFFF
ncbi:MAG: M28 family peptidase [Prolixibacteraceae bacterium]|nr:M28 family peptidase [Prolixibacteraceae bacterium]